MLCDFVLQFKAMNREYVSKMISHVETTANNLMV